MSQPDLTRREKFDLVWSMPTERVAENFGLSGASLGTIGGRHYVPIPPRSYWTRTARGKDVKETRLYPMARRVDFPLGLARLVRALGSRGLVLHPEDRSMPVHSDAEQATFSLTGRTEIDPQPAHRPSGNGYGRFEPASVRIPAPKSYFHVSDSGSRKTSAGRPSCSSNDKGPLQKGTPFVT